MSYKFIRRISKGVAEVSTPDGHTIRLPYTGSPPNRGSIVQPQKDNCCCPQRLQFDSGPNKTIRTDPTPRRVSQGRPPLPAKINRILFIPNTLIPLIPYVQSRPIYTFQTYDDGFYLPFTNRFPLVGVTIDPVNKPVKDDVVGVVPPTLFCFFVNSFDQWEYRDPLPGAKVSTINKIYVVDAYADINDYKINPSPYFLDSGLPRVYSALQQFHPGCNLYIYRETDNRELPEGRLEPMFAEWWEDPLAFDYKKWPDY